MIIVRLLAGILPIIRSTKVESVSVLPNVIKGLLYLYTSKGNKPIIIIQIMIKNIFTNTYALEIPVNK